MSISAEQKKGAIFAIAAYVMWGLAPIYFKLIDSIDAIEILVHRVVWSSALLVVFMLVAKHWSKVQVMLRQPKQLAVLALSACLLGFNWGMFIWAVNNEHMLDASLGYYINPLLNVLLGMMFLGERLNGWQKFAVFSAFSGVVIQLVSFGSFPVISFALAGSFAIYGLLRKKVSVDAVTGLLFESLFLLPLALFYWWGYIDSNTSDITQNNWIVNGLLIATGIVTTAPLLCFIGGARRLQYSTMGFFQYIGPSLMFILGVFVYGEVVGQDRWVSFGFIWFGLIVYSLDAYFKLKRK
ncbi:EamA family transporter RarD [Flocculibacter collagenilyticus]|uniref:EamA family transporter RarD n=1 Tax=Flocculibacter collagenilyticus TaxID=2744479 RepID=UPI0018F52A40|nr:EamA family transporter RarD [Flocculibacter collagenilyticus]